MTYLTVLGHTNLDHILYVNSLPEPNITVEVTKTETCYGGVGGNIARTASRLGVPTSLVSYVGDDFDEGYFKALADDGVELTHFKKLPKIQSPACWIISKGAEQENYMLFSDLTKELKTSELPDYELFKSTEMLHLTTERPDYYKKIIEQAEPYVKQIVFDPSQAIHYYYTKDDFKKLLNTSGLLFLNETELKVAMKFMDVTKPEQLMEYVDTLVITRGKSGSRVFNSRDVFEIPIVQPEKLVDITGAGDAYRAGFYAGLYRGYPIEDCGLLGAATSSFVVEAAGPQTNLPTWEMVLERFEADKN